MDNIKKNRLKIVIMYLFMRTYFILLSTITLLQYIDMAEVNTTSCPFSGNGICDEKIGYFGNNDQECSYDGGDCCISSCGMKTHLSMKFSCGIAGYSCRDPKYNVIDHPYVMTYSLLMGNISASTITQTLFNQVLDLTLIKLFELSKSNISTSGGSKSVNLSKNQDTTFLFTFEFSLNLLPSDTFLALKIMDLSVSDKTYEKLIRYYSRILTFEPTYYVRSCPSFESPTNCVGGNESSAVQHSTFNNASTYSRSKCTLDNDEWNYFYNNPDKLPFYIVFLIVVTFNWASLLLAYLLQVSKAGVAGINNFSFLTACCIFCRCYYLIYLVVNASISSGTLSCVELQFCYSNGSVLYFLITIWFYISYTGTCKCTAVSLPCIVNFLRY
jgi:hypothetical protein